MALLGSPGVLVLEDGRAFVGQRFGAKTPKSGEVVFNTSLIGYQEVLSDPSYAGQMVVMTYPMIGNYGLAPEDFESKRPHLSALLVKEPSRITSNWRSKFSLEDYLRDHDISGLFGFDTRALVRHLTKHGALRGVLDDAAAPRQGLVKRARALPSMVGCDLASVVSCKEPYSWKEPTALGPPPAARPGKRVVVYDFGVKYSILRNLTDAGCEVRVVPSRTPASEVLAWKPDGVVLSNGPGDPEPVEYAVHNIKGLLGKIPVFGICLGHQLLGIACGGKTYKLKFGHHGGNHPVMDLATRKVEITAHNHNFAVDPSSLPASVEVTHTNLNDQCCEGLKRKDLPAMSVQYHPEGGPGPHDAHYLFKRFVDLMWDFSG